MNILEYFNFLFKKKSNITFSKKTFLSFYQGSIFEQNASECYDEISRALKNQGIYSEWTLIGALATTRVEVGRLFLPIIEQDSGIKYEHREDLGNIYPGDGERFKGRGYIQITGRYNYENYGLKLGVDLVGNPDLALEPKVAADILAIYFKETGANIACDNNDWKKVRLLVNGGLNGFNLFKNIINQYSQKIIIENNKKMQTVKWVKFFTSNVAEYQTLHLTPNDDGKKTLQDNGQTHDFANSDDAIAKSTSEVFIFWDNVPVGVGSLQA